MANEISDKDLIILILKDNPMSMQKLKILFMMVKKAIDAERWLMK